MWRDWDRERLRHVSASLRCLPQTKPHEHERWCLSLRCCSKLPYTGWLKQQKSQVKGPAGLVSGESQFSGSWAAGFLLWPLMTVGEVGKGNMKKSWNYVLWCQSVQGVKASSGKRYEAPATLLCSLSHWVPSPSLKGFFLTSLKGHR